MNYIYYNLLIILIYFDVDIFENNQFVGILISRDKNKAQPSIYSEPVIEITATTYALGYLSKFEFLH